MALYRNILSKIQLQTLFCSIANFADIFVLSKTQQRTGYVKQV